MCCAPNWPQPSIRRTESLYFQQGALDMQRKWTLTASLSLIGLLAFALAACGGGPGGGSGDTTNAAASGDAALGATVFAGTCSSCHGPDAKGIAGLGKDLTTSTFVAGLSDADLATFIKTGRPTSDPLNTTGVD